MLVVVVVVSEVVVVVVTEVSPGGTFFINSSGDRFGHGNAERLASLKMGEVGLAVVVVVSVVVVSVWTSPSRQPRLTRSRTQYPSWSWSRL